MNFARICVLIYNTKLCITQYLVFWNELAALALCLYMLYVYLFMFMSRLWCTDAKEQPESDPLIKSRGGDPEKPPVDSAAVTIAGAYI